MGNIPILSTGQKSTIGVWIELATKYFGPDSKQVKFLKARISVEKGLDEPVLADEVQLINILVNLPDDY